MTQTKFSLYKRLFFGGLCGLLIIAGLFSFAVPALAVTTNTNEQYLTDTTNNRQYVTYTDNDALCKIYVVDNQGTKTKNGKDISGRSCTKAGQDVSNQCSAINANHADEGGGASKIQINCNPGVISYSTGKDGVIAWSYNGGDTYVLQDKNGNALTVSKTQLKAVCGDSFQSGGAGKTVACPAIADSAAFQKAIQDKVCSNQAVDDRNPFAGQCKGVELTNIAKNPASITGDLSKATASKDADRQSSNLGDQTKKGAFALARALTDLVSALLLVVFYILGWLAIGLMHLVAGVFLLLVQVNPAGSEFINVALEPWKIVYGIANLITLAAFLYVGFSYILGQKIRKIEDFITNIIIITIALNFTFFATATFVNITQGIGDLFIGSYTTQTGGKAGDIVGGLIDGIETISIIRCGNFEPASSTSSSTTTTSSSGSKDCQSGEVQRLLTTIASGLANTNAVGIIINIYGGWAGGPTAALISEVAFLVVMAWAIYVMARATITALFRVVGLWLLMITSPFALAAYFSPIPGLKKVADQWVSKFLYLSVFYPVFILGLILVSLLARTFGSAAKANLSSLGNSGVNAVAAGGSASSSDLFGFLVGIILTSAVAIGSLQYLVNFLDKDLENIAGGVWDWTKKSLAVTGGVVAGAGKLGSSVSRAVGGRLNSIRGNAGTQIEAANYTKSAILQERKAGTISKEEAREAFNQQDSIINKARRTQSRVDAARRGGQFARRVGISGTTLQNAGRFIRVAPVIPEILAGLPKNYLDNLDRTLQADYAEEGARFKGRLEGVAKTNPLVREALEGLGYDFSASKERVFNARTREELEKEAQASGKTLKEYMSEQIEFNAKDVRTKKLGVDLRPASFAVQSSIFESIIKNAAGNLNNLSAQDLDRLNEIILNSVNDDSGTLASRIFSNRNARDLVQQGVSSGLIRDTKVLQGIEKRLPSLLSEQDARAAGVEVANDPRRANEVFDITKKTSDPFRQGVIQTTIQNGGKISDAMKILGSSAQNGYSTSGVNAGRTAFRGSSMYQQLTQDLDPKQRELFDKQVDAYTTTGTLQGMNGRSEQLIRQSQELLGKYRESGELNDDDYTQAAKAIQEKIYKSEFGDTVGAALHGGNLQGAEAALTSTPLAQLEQTSFGKKIAKSQSYQRLPQVDKERAMRAAFLQTAYSVDQNNLGEGKNAFENELTTGLQVLSKALVEADHKSGTQQQTAYVLSDAISQIKKGDVNARDVVSSENIGLRKALGNSKLLEQITQELNENGKLTIANREYDFKDVSGDDIQKISRELGQILAMRDSSDERYSEQASSRLETLADQYNTGPIADLLTTLAARQDNADELGTAEINGILQSSRKNDGSFDAGRAASIMQNMERSNTKDVNDAYTKAYEEASKIDPQTARKAIPQRRTIRLESQPASRPVTPPPAAA